MMQINQETETGKTADAWGGGNPLFILNSNPINRRMRIYPSIAVLDL